MDTLLTPDELAATREELAGWDLSCEKLRRSFKFSNFQEAMMFMVRVSYEAESLQHHPNWSNVYANVEVEIWSHDRGGVTGRCLALARCMQQVSRQIAAPR